MNDFFLERIAAIYGPIFLYSYEKKVSVLNCSQLAVYLVFLTLVGWSQVNAISNRVKLSC